MDDSYSYQITQRAEDLGGGWTLVLLKNDEEMDGGVFPGDEYGEVLDEGEAWVASFKKTESTPSDALNETIQTIQALMPIVLSIADRFPRDKAAIDFARAMLANPPRIYETQQIDMCEIAQTAVDLADALVKQLQVTAPAPAREQ